MKAEKGTPPDASQRFLEPDKINQGYFLACQCYPEQDMQVSLPKRNKIQAVITSKVTLNPTVVALEIAPRHPVPYAPGQYLSLWTPDLMPRLCYLASIPEQDEHLTLHIGRRANGAFSHWVHDCTQTGQKILISDVRGLKFYQTFSSTLSHTPFIMIAQEGCLAPLLAILRQTYTLRPDFHACLILQMDLKENLYCMDTITALDKAHAMFSYGIITSEKEMEELEQQLPSLPANSQCLIAGTQPFIDSIRRYRQENILPLPYS